jgi:hypothetical protein
VDAHLVTLLADALGAVARGEHGQALGYVERALKALKGQQTLPGIAPAPPDLRKSDAQREAAIRIFAYWQTTCGKGAGARLNSTRGNAVVARLREGYSEAEIRKAIDGAAAAAYVSPDNGTKYDDLELICRNGTKLESFIERGLAATGAIIAEKPASVPGVLVEERIAQLRRTMATMRKDGRDTEYQQASAELAELLKKRAG